VKGDRPCGPWGEWGKVQERSVPQMGVLRGAGWGHELLCINERTLTVYHLC